MSAVAISVFEPFARFYETALRNLGGTDLDQYRSPDNTDEIIITVDLPGVPDGAQTMAADLVLTTDRPAHIETATFKDANGQPLGTVNYP